MSKSKPVNSVATAFLILEALARHQEPSSLTAISAELGSTKTKVHRHLQTLMALGYVKQLGNGGHYTLTAKLRHVAQGSPPSASLLSAAQVILPRLRDQLNLSITLGRATSAGVEILEIARANTLVQITTQPGALFALDSSAHGKVALSFGSDLFLDSVEKGIAEALEAELKAIRKRGWAVAPGEILAGINAVAVPLLTSSGELLGSIAALGPMQSVPREPPAALVEALKGAAQHICDRFDASVEIAI
jgi:DNA-binding IclR family transcriptional regulator